MNPIYLNTKQRKTCWSDVTYKQLGISSTCFVCLLFTFCQENSEGRKVLCATVLLDRGLEGLQQRVANKVYEACRAGGSSLEVVGFPDYKPLLQALQSTQPEDVQSNYQVTVKRHDKLLVLSTLAQKFLDHDDFKAEALGLIEQHNENFNPDGDWMAEPEQARTVKIG